MLLSLSITSSTCSSSSIWLTTPQSPKNCLTRSLLSLLKLVNELTPTSIKFSLLSKLSRQTRTIVIWRHSHFSCLDLFWKTKELSCFFAPAGMRKSLLLAQSYHLWWFPKSNGLTSILERIASQNTSSNCHSEKTSESWKPKPGKKSTCTTRQNRKRPTASQTSWNYSNNLSVKVKLIGTKKVRSTIRRNS